MFDGLSVAPTSSLDNLVVVHHGVDCWWEPDLYGPVLVGGAEGGWAEKRSVHTQNKWSVRSVHDGESTQVPQHTDEDGRG